MALAHHQRVNPAKPRQNSYHFNEPPAEGWLSVSASLGEGGSGSAVEESKHGWALLNQGGNQGSLRTGFACEFGRLVGGRVFLPLPLVAMPFLEASLWNNTGCPWVAW